MHFRAEPATISGFILPVVAIASGFNHNLAIDSAGNVWAWGQNNDGQLGISNTTSYRYTPAIVNGIGGPATSIAASMHHSLAADAAGHAWGWGANTSGELGNGPGGVANQYTPVQVRNGDNTSNLNNISAVAAGYNFSLALDSSGGIWAWGSNSNKQLGQSGASSSLPLSVSLGSGVVASAIAANYSQGLALAAGQVYVWGWNNYPPNTQLNTPAAVSNLSNVTAISAGNNHNLALKTDGTVWGWGSNDCGQLGKTPYSFNGNNYTGSAVKVENISGATLIAAGGSASLATVSSSITALNISGFSDPITAGIAQNYSVTAKDASNNTVTGYTGTVHITSSDSKATQIADYTFTGSGQGKDNGVHVFNITLKTAGPQTITFTDTANSLTGQAGLTVNPGAAASLEFSGIPAVIEAYSNNTFTLTAKDAWSNTATGYTGTVHFSSDGSEILYGHSTLPADYTFIQGNAGTHTFGNKLTFYKPGLRSLTATDLNSGISGTQSNIQVNAIAFILSDEGNHVISRMVAAGYGDYSVFDAMWLGMLQSYPSIPSSLQWELLNAVILAPPNSDIFTKKIKDYTGQAVALCSDGTVHVLSNTTGSSFDGQAGVTTLKTNLDTVGSYNLTYKSSTTALNSFQFNSNTYDIIAIVWMTSPAPTGATYLTFSGIPTYVQANTSCTMTLTARDANGQVATGYTGMVQIRTTDGAAIIPLQYTFVSADQGTHTFTNGVTLKTVDSQDIWAYDDANHVIEGRSANIHVYSSANGGNAKSFIFSHESGDLVAKIIAAGYGDYSVFDFLWVGMTNSNPVLPGDLLGIVLQSAMDAKPGNDIFTKHVKDFSGKSFLLNSDCTVQETNILASTYYNQAGTATLDTAMNGVATYHFTYTSDYVTPLTSWQTNSKTYDLLALAWTSTVASSDAKLSSLAISSGTLTPAFASGTTSYTAGVDNSVTSMTVTPTVNESHATVTVNGGNPSVPINLIVGANTINVVVTAQDGATSKTYTITVTRASPSLPLAMTTFALKPGIAGMAYSQTLAATGGNGPYNWSSVGALPANLSIDASTGELHGTTSPAGTYSLTIQLGDSVNTINRVFSIQILASGNLYAWGDGNNGQIGDGGHVTRLTPTLVSQNSGLTSAVSIATGNYHALALKPDGTVWAWGSNALGQLGNNTTNDSFVPIQVKGPGGVGYLTDVIQVAAGVNYSLALKSDGTVWTWGYNSSGQLGNGTTTNSLSPVQVNGLNGVVNLAACGFHNLAVKADGSVWAWGQNYHGELGIGTTTIASSPVQVVGLSGILGVGAGSYHSLAVDASGAVYAWGWNAGYGQLYKIPVFGDPENILMPVATGITSLTTAGSLTGGYGFSAAVLSDGTVMTSGSNSGGQLGSGTAINDYEIVHIANLSQVKTVSAGNAFCLAKTSNGNVWAWGVNNMYQLGDGTNTDRPTAFKISGLIGVSAIATGGDFSLVIGTLISNDANLSGLTISSGLLSPVFASATTSYTDSVDNSVASVTVTPAVNESHATVAVNSTAVTSGSPSGAITLNVGANTVTVVVTAQDGITTKTYTITVNRAPSSNDATLSNLVISSGTLTPVFASATIVYTDGVAYASTSVTVTPTANESHATITVNGNAVTSGSPSGAINLNVGANTITVVVTAQDGTTTDTYTIAVTRAAPSADATLSNLVISSGTLTPVFASATTAYTDSVPYAVTSVTITPTVTEIHATVGIVVNPIQGTISNSASFGSPFAPISLNVGNNTITVVVTAQDGTTNKTYTITITRAPAPVQSGPGNSGNVVSTLVSSGFNSSPPLRIDDGGIVQSASQLKTPDGQVAIDISQGTRLTDSRGNAVGSLNIAPLSQSVTPPSGSVLVLAFSFGPEGATFNPALTITMKYNKASLPANVQEKDLKIVYYNGSTWQTLTCTVDPVNGTVTAQITHFSTYALLGTVTVPPTATPAPAPVPSPAPVTTTPAAPAPTTAPITTPAPIATSPIQQPLASTAPTGQTAGLEAPAGTPKPTPAAPAPGSSQNNVTLIISIIVIVLILSGLAVVLIRRASRGKS